MAHLSWQILYFGGISPDTLQSHLLMQTLRNFSWNKLSHFLCSIVLSRIMIIFFVTISLIPKFERVKFGRLNAPKEKEWDLGLYIYIKYVIYSCWKSH